ncbi:GNAT family N-acetyltransferase [Jatrophihabitans telluris]|uniref:GNAT family N-acetyltransferase n=1 Tax=Jatrophihabitans telluris TaxID=2038343 RepID=A0ABY4R5D5_9ACTN|nr:GNAT family N-acetyltransferase [Jatrophihabitans telluris]UQX90222.1 GNAT family N-acetyltransferase [Jatrophihabitans telluris]
MPAAEIRHVPFEEILPWLRTMRTTFLDDPATPFSDAQRDYFKRQWDGERSWGAYDGRWVATLRTFGTTLTVPGGPDGDTLVVQADALTMVSVAATHRRQGLLTGMLTPSLDEARARGEAVSVLRAAEWPIYGRFGYAPAAFAANYRVVAEPPVRVVPPRRPVTIRQVEPAELLSHALPVFEAIRRQRPGQIDRTEPYWHRRIGLDGLRPAGQREPVCIVAIDEGGRPVGFTTWSAGEGDWFEEKMELTLGEFMASSSDGYRALWTHLLGIDLIRGIRWIEQAVDEPLEWLISDGRAARRELTRDGLWLRILDVEAALAARRYAVADRLVVEVVDGDGLGWAAGRYTLDASPSHAECIRTPTAAVDLRLSQRALAAVYLSGNTVRSQVLAGLVDEESPDAVRRFEAMLAADRAPANVSPF